jgi:hypothetical protein
LSTKERNGQRSYKKASVFSRGRARHARADNGQQTQNADSHNYLAYPPNVNFFMTAPKAFSRFLETTPTTPQKKKKKQYFIVISVFSYRECKIPIRTTMAATATPAEAIGSHRLVFSVPVI